MWNMGWDGRRRRGEGEYDTRPHAIRAPDDTVQGHLTTRICKMHGATLRISKKVMNTAERTQENDLPSPDTSPCNTVINSKTKSGLLVISVSRSVQSVVGHACDLLWPLQLVLSVGDVFISQRVSYCLGLIMPVDLQHRKLVIWSFVHLHPRALSLSGILSNLDSSSSSLRSSRVALMPFQNAGYATMWEH